MYDIRRYFYGTAGYSPKCKNLVLSYVVKRKQYEVLRSTDIYDVFSYIRARPREEYVIDAYDQNNKHYKTIQLLSKDIFQFSLNLN